MKAHFEKITSSPENSFKAFIYEEHEFSAPWHFHPEYELTCILNSKGMRYVGDSVQQFEEEDLVLVGANLPHCWKNTGDYQGLSTALVIQWREDILGEGWLQKKEFINIQQLLKQAARGLKFSHEVNVQLKDTLMSIVDQPPFDKLIILLKILNQLAASEQYELLCGNSFSYNLDHEANEKINKIYNYVRERYQHKIKLQEIASLVAMSETAFCRFFKKKLNKSFFTFVNEYRIHMPSKLLIETDRQVAQIGYECGYESLPFFYRQFQKFMHCSPFAYKKKYLQVIR
jgi:AraC-like DNA-binding protein